MKIFTKKTKPLVVSLIILVGLLGVSIGVVAQTNSVAFETTEFINSQGQQNKHGRFVVMDQAGVATLDPSDSNPSNNIDEPWLPNLKLFVDNMTSAFAGVETQGDMYVSPATVGSPTHATFGGSTLDTSVAVSVNGNILGTAFTNPTDFTQVRELCTNPNGLVGVCTDYNWNIGSWGSCTGTSPAMCTGSFVTNTPALCSGSYVNHTVTQSGACMPRNLPSQQLYVQNISGSGSGSGISNLVTSDNYCRTRTTENSCNAELGSSSSSGPFTTNVCTWNDTVVLEVKNSDEIASLGSSAPVRNLIFPLHEDSAQLFTDDRFSPGMVRDDMQSTGFITARAPYNPSTTPAGTLIEFITESSAQENQFATLKITVRAQPNGLNHPNGWSPTTTGLYDVELVSIESNSPTNPFGVPSITIGAPTMVSCSSAGSQALCLGQSPSCTWNSGTSATVDCSTADISSASACTSLHPSCTWVSGQSRTRTVVCEDSNANAVAESFCTQPKPPTQTSIGC